MYLKKEAYIKETDDKSRFCVSEAAEIYGIIFQKR
jgi:hypothetical protein